MSLQQKAQEEDKLKSDLKQDNEDPDQDEEGEDGEEDDSENEDNEDKKSDDQNKQQQVTGDKELSLQRYLFTSKAICFVLIIFDIAFAEFLCMFRQICDFSNVEIPSPYGTTVIIFLFITIILTILNYYLIDTINKAMIRFFKYFFLIWSLLLITFAILCFIQQGDMEENEKLQETWDNLTPFSKTYYKDLVDLQEINENNLMFSGIYYIITGILLLMLFVIVSNMEGIMPTNWRPRTQILNPGCEGHQVILNYRRKQRERMLKAKLPKITQKTQLNQVQYTQHIQDQDYEDPNRKAKPHVPEGFKEKVSRPY